MGKALIKDKRKKLLFHDDIFKFYVNIKKNEKNKINHYKAKI